LYGCHITRKELKLTFGREIDSNSITLLCALANASIVFGIQNHNRITANVKYTHNLWYADLEIIDLRNSFTHHATQLCPTKWSRCILEGVFT